MGMKNKKILKLRNALIKLIIHFTTVFSMLTVLFIGISSLIGGIEFSNIIIWILILAISLIESVVFYFIFKIDRMSLFVQITIVYFIFTLFLYILGYLLRIFNRSDIKFVLITFGMVLVGYIVISLILLFKNKRENDRLNKELKKFKERD